LSNGEGENETMGLTILQRLFWQKPTDLVTPLENFASTALAMAISHDPQPFLRVLQGVSDWKPASGRPSIDLGAVTRVDVKTQDYLATQPDAESGYLDLVVAMTDRSGRVDTAWVEVKVDAALTLRDPASPEGSPQRDQLDVYMAQRPSAEHNPFVITLAKVASVRGDVTGVTWDDVADAASAVLGSRGVWADLVDFLVAERIVLPPLPPNLTEWQSFESLFRDINNSIKRLWPSAPKPLYYGDLKRPLAGAFQRHELLLTGGPLTYGLRNVGGVLEWWIALGSGSGYWRVQVPVGEVIEAAQQGGLSSSWTRTDEHHGDRYEVYECRRPYLPGERSEVSTWFAEKLGELNDADMLEPYHRGLMTRLTV
jgi:hypothetical protein